MESFPLRRRIRQFRDADNGARGPLVNFIMSNYKAISLGFVFLFAANTIRVGITSLDIGVRDNEHLPPEMQQQKAANPSSMSFSSSEDTIKVDQNDNPNAAEGSAAAMRRDQSADMVGMMDNLNVIPGGNGENPSAMVIDPNMVTGGALLDPQHAIPTEKITTSTPTTKISSGAAMSLGSFQIPVQNIQAPPQMNAHQAPPPLVGAPKNIMVIGGVGFIGFHTCLHLRQLGHSVVSYDVQTETGTADSISPNADKLHILQTLHDIPTIQGDACDSAKLYATLERFQVTHVIYLASQSYERGHGGQNQVTTSPPAANATYIEEGGMGMLPADENGNIVVDITAAELQEEVPMEEETVDNNESDGDEAEAATAEDSKDVFGLRGRDRARRSLQEEVETGYDDADDDTRGEAGNDADAERIHSFSFLGLPAPTHAFEYPPNNLDCFANLLDIVRGVDIHVVYASSTHGFQFQDRGVYQYGSAAAGGVSREEVPHPTQFHPTTQRSNEVMAESYSILYDISTVGVRFPTVYGPFGRPDFTYYHYLQAVVEDANAVPVTLVTADNDHNGGNSTAAATASDMTAEQPSEPSVDAKIQIPFVMTRDNIDAVVKQEMQLSLIHVDDVVKNLVAALDLTQAGAAILTAGRACATPASTVIKMMEDSLHQIRQETEFHSRAANQHNVNGAVEPNNMIDAGNEYAHSEQYVDRSMDPQAVREAQVAETTQAATAMGMEEDAISEASLTFDPEHKLLNVTTNTQRNTDRKRTSIDYVDVTNEHSLMSSSPIFANMTSPRCLEGKSHGEISLWEGIHAFVYWYDMEGGKDRVTPPISEAASLDEKADEEGNGSVDVPIAGPPTDICHVTASFAETDDKADKVPSVAHLSHDSPNRYLFFTNLPDLECDGWERIVMREMPFRRFITQSRWPKFMGWLHPDLQNCKVVLYADAIWRPQKLPQSEWEGLANLTLASDAGITQQIRPFNHSGMRELNFIKSHRKDIKRNVAASREWFLSQSDFNNTSTSYRNNAFVYDPHNANFRQLMTTFWTHYAQEEDSWRDQPLYRYLVNKLKLSPALYPKDKDSGKKGQVRDYWEEKGKKGFNGHHYKDGDDENANAKPKRR